MFDKLRSKIGNAMTFVQDKVGQAVQFVKDNSEKMAAFAAAPIVADTANSIGGAMGPYDYTTVMSLTIDLDTTQLFTGAQLIIDALSSPYLLIAGLGLGVAILGAILNAVTKLRM